MPSVRWHLCSTHTPPFSLMYRSVYHQRRRWGRHHCGLCCLQHPLYYWSVWHFCFAGTRQNTHSHRDIHGCHALYTLNCSCKVIQTDRQTDRRMVIWVGLFIGLTKRRETYLEAFYAQVFTGFYRCPKLILVSLSLFLRLSAYPAGLCSETQCTTHCQFLPS